MKKFYLYLLLIGLLTFVYEPCQAQIWKKVKKSVERTVENRAEREAEKAANDAIDDAIKEAQENDEDGDREEGNTDFMNFAMGSSADVPDQYVFNYEINYEITTNDDESNLTYLLDDKGSYFGFLIEDEKDRNKMVMDLDQNLVIMFMENKKGEKTGQVLPSFVSKQYLSDKISEANSDAKVVKTGRTKNILGYTCHEYDVTSQDGSANLWIAPEIRTSLTKVFGASMAKNKRASSMANLMRAMEGFVMESHYRDNKEKNNSDMIATHISLSPAPIKKEDYQWSN